MTKPGKSNGRGTTLIEAAIILPLLVMLTLGAIEYGWLFLNAQRITNAARQGARMAILPHPTALADAASVVDALLTDAGLGDDSPIVTITPGPIPGDPAGREGVTVQIVVSTATLAIVRAEPLIPIPDTLRATFTMAKEGI